VSAAATLRYGDVVLPTLKRMIMVQAVQQTQTLARQLYGDEDLAVSLCELRILHRPVS
jgi:hypothetical protein